MEEILKGKVQALIPEYSKSGTNATRVKLIDRDILIEKSIKSVLNDICKIYHYDLKASNKSYGDMINIKKTPPILFTRDLIFIAVKTRKPIGRDDGAYSYINIEAVEKVKDGKIYFENANTLKTMTRQETLEKNISLAKLLKAKTTGKQLLVREIATSYDICIEDEISLKEDLLIIYRRLQQIEKRLFK